MTKKDKIKEAYGEYIEDAEWTSARWCNNCDEWHPSTTKPTHWFSIPKPPIY